MAPEATEPRRMSRLDIPADMSNRVVGRGAPKYHALGSKPLPEHSSAMIRASVDHVQEKLTDSRFGARASRLRAGIVSPGCAGAGVQRSWCGDDLTAHCDDDAAAVSPSNVSDDRHRRHRMSGRYGRLRQPWRLLRGS